MTLSRARFAQLVFSAVLFIGLIGLAAQPILASASTDTMVGYWPLDGSAVDVSGSGNDFTANGSPSYSTAIPSTITFPDSNSIAFTGTQYLSLASNSSVNVTNLTISAWVRFNNVNSTYQTIAGKWQVGVRQQYVLQLNSDNSIGLFTGDGGTGIGYITTNGTFTPSNDTWYHILATVNGTSGAIYINGVSRASGSVSAIGTSVESLTVGGKRNGGGTFYEFLNGNIDDLRIYNRALSSTEIAALAGGSNTSATWTGASSSDWETANNWNPSVTPDPYTQIVIPANVPYPILSSNQTTAGLTVQSGGILDLAGYSLSYNANGSLTNNGSIYTNGPPRPNVIPPSSTGQNSTPSCSSSAPQASPDLFQIDAGGNYVNLYFTAPIGGDGYAISYGLTPGADQFGDNFIYPGADWIVGRTINSLEPNTTYYFKIRRTNGCNAGHWSQVKSITTRNPETEVTAWYANLRR